MKVFRIANKKYANLDGTGGLYSWGRWHNKGFRVIYTAESRALAAWEKIVHVSNVNLLPDNLVLVEIKIPDNNIVKTPNDILEQGWDGYPYINKTIQYGSDFLSNTNNLILQVPSVIIQDEFNFIINPSSKDIHLCEIINITPFKFDERIIKG